MAKPEPIHGHIIPAPRFTPWAWLYFTAFVAVPILGVALLLDIALFFIFRDVFGRCYGLLCLL